MPEITFKNWDGESNTIEADLGSSVMEVAVQNGIEGIDADCGGSCACATCHVYIDGNWESKLEPPADIEKSMLDFVVDYKSNSRLACQIPVTLPLDGLIVKLPESQH